MVKGTTQTALTAIYTNNFSGHCRCRRVSILLSYLVGPCKCRVAAFVVLNLKMIAIVCYF